MSSSLQPDGGGTWFASGGAVPPFLAMASISTTHKNKVNWQIKCKETKLVSIITRRLWFQVNKNLKILNILIIQTWGDKLKGNPNIKRFGKAYSHHKPTKELQCNLKRIHISVATLILPVHVTWSLSFSQFNSPVALNCVTHLASRGLKVTHDSYITPLTIWQRCKK